MATEVGVAYVNIIPKADGFSEGVANASREAGTAGASSIKDSIFGTLQSTFGELFGTGGEMGSKLAGGMESFLSGAGKLAIGAAVAAIGVEALSQLNEIGAEIDSMADTIIVGTGAAGEQLESLKQTAMGVSTDVPVGFAKSGDIIQDFNTRLGLSGEALENVASHAAQLDYIVGGINYDNMATMFNVWGVGADDMNAKMDYMFGIAQNTGIGFDSLASIMKTAGPTLQNLGFSFEESANMAGLLDKAGIDASSTMSRMSKALVKLSEPGESAQEAFRRTVDEMQAFIDAGDTASAMNLAEDLFGSRGAAQFVAALQSGALSMDALSDAALGATGNIEGTYEATKSWPEQWALIQTRVQAALEPLASGVFSALGAVLDTASAAMTRLWQASEPLRAKLAEIAAGLGERLKPIIDALGPAFSALADGAFALIGDAFDKAAAAIGILADAMSFLYDNAIAPLGDGLSTLAGIVEGVVDTVSSAFSGMQSAIVDALGTARDFVGSAADVIGQRLGFPGLCDTVRGVFDGISSFISDPIGTARDVIGGIIDEIVGFFSGLGERITSAIGSIHFPTPHVKPGAELDIMGMKFSLPTVEWYATGGIVDGPTLIGAGEAGPEAVLPLQGSYMRPFAEAVASYMPQGGNTYIIERVEYLPDTAISRHVDGIFDDVIAGRAKGAR